MKGLLLGLFFARTLWAVVIIPKHPPITKEFQKALQRDRLDRFLGAVEPKENVKTRNGWLWGSGSDMATRRNNEAMIFVVQNDLPRAAEILEEVIQKDRLFFPARFNLGKIYLMTRRHQKALNQFRIARDLLPGYWKNYYWMGKAYEKIGDLNSAEYHYKLSYIRNPYDLNSLIAIGDLFLERGRLIHAKEMYRHALRLDDGFNNALIGLGKVEYRLRRYYEATLWFRAVNTSAPYHKEYHYYYAESAFFARMYATAVKQYKFMLQFPQDPIYDKISLTRIRFRLKQSQRLALQKTAEK